MYILWFRHGFSCANYLSAVDPLYLVTGRLEYDARLTGLGKKQAISMAPKIFNKLKKINDISTNTKLENIPIIFTSMLSRAIETSDSINQGLLENSILEKPFTIVVIPYIEEIPLSITASQYIYLDRQNEPRNIHKVRRDLGIDVSVYEEVNPYDEYGDPITSFNIDKFYEHSLPKIVNLLEKEGYPITENSVITLVSHRKTIERATGISLGNFGSVLQKLKKNSINFTSSFTSLDVDILFEGFTDSWGVENIELEDLKSCRTERASEIFLNKK